MMPANGSIRSTTKHNITTIEFHHPKGNSLPGNLLREMAEAIEEAGQNEESHVVVLRSKGETAFCAGASFDELLAISNFDEGKAFFMGFANLLNTMRTCPKFIIARVQGKTVGGGLGIVAAADYAFAHRSASVKLSELGLGIGPFVVGPALGRKMGPSAFTTLSLDARSWFDSGWAESKDLYSKVLDSIEKLDEAVDKLAGELASSNPESMQEFKKILWKGTGHWHATLEQRAELSGRLVISDFTRKSIEEFVNR